MDVQQIIALSIVALAAGYLGRNGWRAWRAFRQSKGGCASGCGKCGFAGKDPAEGAARPQNVIALTDIRAASTQERQRP